MAAANLIGAADLIIMGQDWLQAGSIADIAPLPDGDGIVNLRDFAVIVQHWLEGTGP